MRIKAIDSKKGIINYVIRKDDKVKFFRNEDGTYSLNPEKDRNGNECLVYKYTLERLMSTGSFEIPFDKMKTSKDIKKINLVWYAGVLVGVSLDDKIAEKLRKKIIREEYGGNDSLAEVQKVTLDELL